MTVGVRARAVAEEIWGSYWFVPGLLALAGFVAGLGMIVLDFWLGDQWLGRYEWLYGARPDGARQILSTIAGSTITVAGVVFSITLAAVTYASGQYGPRLLSNFTRDRGNQVTLGVFVGTFLYCLVVLRTVRSAEEASADTGGAVRDAFVPHAAMFGALALAILSISVLIYFVHHVTFGIHINKVIAKIGHQLIADIRDRVRDDEQADKDAAHHRVSQDEGMSIPSAETGYVEAIDEEALINFAGRREVVLRLLVRPGDFLHTGRPLLELYPSGGSDDEAVRSCNAAFAFGDQRTSQQDLRFGIDELVEIAARALSPGVNDPFTAIACVDWLGAAISELGRAAPESPAPAKRESEERLIRCPMAFADYLTSAFGQLRPYLIGDPNARAHAAATLGKVYEDMSEDAHRQLIVSERLALLEDSRAV